MNIGVVHVGRVLYRVFCKVNYWTGYIYCVFCCWLIKSECAQLGQSRLDKSIARHDLLSYIVVVCCCVISGIVAPWSFLSCTPCIVWMICFHTQWYPLIFKHVIDCKLTTVDDRCVGYLVRFLSHIELFRFTMAWLHSFKNLLLHRPCLNDDCWLYRQLPLRHGMWGVIYFYLSITYISMGTYHYRSWLAL